VSVLVCIATFLFVYVNIFKLSLAVVIGVGCAALVAIVIRTAPAAFVLVIFVLCLVYIIRRKSRMLIAVFAYGAIGLVALGILHISREAPFEQVERTTDFIPGNESSFEVRLIFWRAALRGLLDRPFTGYGPNGFSVVFWRHATPQEQLQIVKTRLPDEATNIRFTGSPIVIYSLPNEDEPIFTTFGIDKAHNYLLDLTIAAGLTGTILFLIGVISGLIEMFRTNNQKVRAVALGIMTYLLFGVTWFATLPVDPIIWGFFGVGFGYARRTGTEADIDNIAN